jgi:hypothetical protein
MRPEELADPDAVEITGRVEARVVTRPIDNPQFARFAGALKELPRDVRADIAIAAAVNHQQGLLR